MERLLVTQALDERDLLKKKISDSIRRCVVVSTARPSDTKVATGAKIEDFEADAKASFQSVMGLIDRYERLDSAILLANAKEEIDVAGKVMTRAAAINMRKNLVSSSHSTGTDFRDVAQWKRASYYEYESHEFDSHHLYFCLGGFIL